MIIGLSIIRICLELFKTTHAITGESYIIKGFIIIIILLECIYFKASYSEETCFVFALLHRDFGSTSFLCYFWSSVFVCRTMDSMVLCR